MTERTYWSIINLWLLERKDLVPEENEQTKQLSDFDIWKLAILNNESLRRSLGISCQAFFKTKIEFFETTGTIYIGERGSGVFLDESFYLIIRNLCRKLVDYNSNASDEDQQYNEKAAKSEKEREMIAKMKKAQHLLDEKDEHPEDALGRKILALTAIGCYTLEQVYNMTMLQLNMLLKKYVDIQTFELQTQLSPYTSSDSGTKAKFWA